MMKVPEPVNTLEVYFYAIIERLDKLIEMGKSEEAELVASVAKETVNIRTPRKKKGE
mgnify:CR=1 FL=1